MCLKVETGRHVILLCIKRHCQYNSGRIDTRIHSDVSIGRLWQLPKQFIVLMFLCCCFQSNELLC